MRRLLVRFVTVAAVLGAGGFLVAASGVLPLEASSGHWAITRWILEFSLRRTVATHALAVEVPELDDPGLVMRGAGHYETGCRRCHGVPGGRAPVLLRNMLPKPPDLAPAGARYSDAELFYIISNGFKFTGMPGWPADQRYDEVWAMVAFVRTLGRLDPHEYQRLVYGDLLAGSDISPHAASAPAAVTGVCARCHGIDGLGRGVGAFPKLAGQRAEYLYESLRAFSHGSRQSGIMEPIASDLTDEAMREAAAYYSALPGLGRAGGEAQAASAAPEFVLRGDAAREVPACAQCHGPGTAPRNAVYPTLAGQDPGYIRQQLRLFKERRRGGTAYAHLMHHVADHLTEADIEEVAAFYGEAASPPQAAASSRPRREEAAAPQ